MSDDEDTHNIEFYKRITPIEISEKVTKDKIIGLYNILGKLEQYLYLKKDMRAYLKGESDRVFKYKIENNKLIFFVSNKKYEKENAILYNNMILLSIGVLIKK